MFKTFLLLAFRNIQKNKFFVLVNVLGLGTTLACCIVAYLNHRFEADANTIHLNREKIYKVNVFREINGRDQRYGISPISLAPALEQRVAGIDQVVRFASNRVSMRRANDSDTEVLAQRVAFVDPNFFEVFTFPLKWGSISTISDVNSIILEAKTSKRFFGDNNPVGESITLFNGNGLPVEFTITGVLEEILFNSLVNFDAITHINNYISMYEVDELNWKNWIAGTFLTISNPADVLNVENWINGFIEIQNKAREDWKITKYELMSLHAFTKASRDIWANWIGVNLHPAQIIGPLVMAILIMLLASFNYMNTSISIANTRLKEIGVRKAMGSSRRQLIVQFLGENALICFLALLVSLVIAIFLLDEYNKMWSYMELKMDFIGNIGFWIFLIFLLVFTSVLAGAYSAFYISSFKPVDVFKGNYKLKEGGWLSKILLWFQMTVSIVALIAGFVFTQNAKFQQTIDMGYDMDMVLLVPSAPGVDIRALKSAYESNPDIKNVVYTSNHIGWGGYSRTVELQDKKTEVRVMEVGTNYLDVMGVRIKEGRGYSSEFESSDVANSVVIDKRTVDELGLTDPIGQVIRLDTLNLKIIGVADNFMMSFWDKPLPTIFWMRTIEPLYLLVVRAESALRRNVYDFLKTEWEKQVPHAPFSGMEQVNIDQESHDVNKHIKHINLFLAIVAIVLSLIALYTLVSLNILKRTKEIGVRTVLGSSQMGVNILISKPFLIIVGISTITGGAGGYYLSSMLLGSLWPVHVPISAISLAFPIALMLILSYVLISIKVYATMKKNPVESLRYE
jgi:ABC-type antimicrobial peptide transport system permease subunit